MSEGERLFWEIWSRVGPLAGVIVGGLVSFLVAFGVDRRRWKHEREEKLAGIERDALAAALEWINPMRNAQTKASLLVVSLLRGEIDVEAFHRDFPQLSAELAKRDPRADQRAVLPDEIYQAGHRIVYALDDLRLTAVRHSAEAWTSGPFMAGYPECEAKLKSLNEDITSLEDRLRRAFRQSF